MKFDVENTSIFSSNYINFVDYLFIPHKFY